MKKSLLIILCCSFLFAGCDILSAPFKLIADLIPVAIQYAPYALMFLEAPDEKIDEQDKQLLVDIKQLKVKNKQFPSVIHSLKKQRKDSKLKIIVALQIRNKEDIKKFQLLYKKYKAKFKISCRMTKLNTANITEYQRINSFLARNKDVVFLGSGSLSGLTTPNWSRAFK